MSLLAIFNFRLAISRLPITLLESTLVDLLVSVENKGLTENLNPLDATLTKNIGGRVVIANQTPDEGCLFRVRHGGGARDLSYRPPGKVPLGQEQRVCRPLPRVTRSHLSCDTLER